MRSMYLLSLSARTRHLSSTVKAAQFMKQIIMQQWRHWKHWDNKPCRSAV